jgi:EmrB/QacA subfamily drug resistance transporter
MRAALLDPEVAHRRRWFTLLVLCLSLVVIGLDNTILNVALPTLGKSVRLGGLAATESQLQWIVDGYTIIFAGLLLTAGSIGDRFGRYGALAFGLAVFGAGSAAASQATSPTMLITLRLVMGVGGAFIMPSTLSILTNVFTDPKERGRAIGVWAGVAAIGIGLGPVTGGFLLAHFWWGSVLLVNVPVVGIALLAGYFLVPTSKDPASPRLDPLGAVLSIGAIGSLLWAVIAGPSHGWGSSNVLIAFWVGTALLLLFLLWELTYSSPMLNIRFFANPRFSAASGAITLTFLGLFGTIFLLTQYLQAVLGFSPLKAGAVLVPQGLGLMIAAPLSARITERLGTKVVVGGGLLIVSASLLLFEGVKVNSPIGYIIGITVIMGLGMANVMAPATESIMGSLPRDKAGVGSAINDTTRQFGGAVGVAVLGSLLSSRYRTRSAIASSPFMPPRLWWPASGTTFSTPSASPSRLRAHWAPACSVWPGPVSWTAFIWPPSPPPESPSWRPSACSPSSPPEQPTPHRPRRSRSLRRLSLRRRTRPTRRWRLQVRVCRGLSQSRPSRRLRPSERWLSVPPP